MKKYALFGLLILSAKLCAAPLAAHWCLAGIKGCNKPLLMNWTPTTLNNAFYNHPNAFIPTQRTNDSIVPFVSYSTNLTPDQMFHPKNAQAQFDLWQDVNTYVYFGGARSQGQVLAPTPGIIKAAHQNGVKVLGTLFFSAAGTGAIYEEKTLERMLTPVKGAYPVATQLCKIAKTLGFDGYFINEETDETTTTDDKFPAFIQYFHDHCKYSNGQAYTLDWYQVPAYTLNDALLVKNTNHQREFIANNAFLDYSWGYSAAQAKALSAAATAIHYPDYKLDFGIDASGSNNYLSQILLLSGILNNHYGSVGEFAFQAVLNGNQSRPTMNQIDSNQRNFFAGATILNGIKPRISATTLPFHTDFNTGQGTSYFVNGQAQLQQRWADIGLQNLLPTWQFQQSNKANAKQLKNTLKASFDYNNAYLGGSSLLIQGELNKGAGTTFNLYQTNLPLNNKSDHYIAEAVSNSSFPGAVNVNMIIKFNTGTMATIPLKSAMTWQKALYSNLNQYQGKTVTLISIQITALKTLSNYQLKIGEIFIGDQNDLNPPTQPSDVHPINGNDPSFTYLTWSKTDHASQYRIYNNGILVGVSNTNIIAIKPSHTEASNNYTVLAVDAAGQ